jgi:hypothetical protein
MTAVPVVSSENLEAVPAFYMAIVLARLGIGRLRRS